jgi:S-adenosylmethionine-diacylgycerolhomoserine-N-methlytransferase
MMRDLSVLKHLLRGEPVAEDHKQRLEQFYAPQAEKYDAFRERLLHGRRTLIEKIAINPGAHVVEFGGGTGRNLHFFGDRINQCASFTLVDLCPPLLAQARQRCAKNGWNNVRCIEADATRYCPEQPVDVVYFSYSLTMIPDWFSAINNALAILKPGGTLAVVDFYVARKHPPTGLNQQSFFRRWFWPLWFNHDGVRPNADHLPYLLSVTDRHWLDEQVGQIPYIPFLRCPYYGYIGSKPKTQLI